MGRIGDVGSKAIDQVKDVQGGGQLGAAIRELGQWLKDASKIPDAENKATKYGSVLNNSDINIKAKLFDSHEHVYGAKLVWHDGQVGIKVAGSSGQFKDGPVITGDNIDRFELGANGLDLFESFAVRVIERWAQNVQKGHATTGSVPTRSSGT